MKTVKNEMQRVDLIREISSTKLPFRVEIKSGERTLDQNALAFRWYGQIWKQGREMDTVQARRFCKWHFGCPIKAAKDDQFAAFIATLESRYPYDELLGTMDFVDVTRDFDTRQFSEYLTTMQSHFRVRGIWLEGLDPHYEQYPEAVA